MSKRPLLLSLLALSLASASLGGERMSWAQSGTSGKAQAEQQERVRIYSDKAVYRRQEKRAQATGHVKIIQDNTTIYADDVLYHEDTKQSFVDNGVKIVQVNKEKEKGRTTVITGVKMTAYHEERRIFLKEAVRMDRESYQYPLPQSYVDNKDIKRERTETALKKARSVVTSDQMEYFTRSENANLDGNVVMLQKDKKITGDKARIRGEADGDLMIVEGNAEVTQIDGRWLVENKIIDNDPKDEEQQRFVREKLIIKADKITFFRATDDLKAEGNVKITQKVGGKERVAVGDEATYSELQQLAALIGNVRLQRENEDWLTSDKALFYTEKEEFQAFGTEREQVISEFTIDEDDERSSKEPLNPALPPFDLDAHEPGQRLPSWLRNRPTPQRAPAQPTIPSAVPAIPPVPRPDTVRGAVPPSAPESPSASAPPAASPAPPTTPAPQPVESSFTIQTDE
ncbi:MAG: LPS export ABC transporter periplasmic protein LptC [Candidatus Sericytochromatia bacterium]|nr:LPS export ABC transporter periplasmic protein LptC [Candidatus Sericytochromatia bacterium]